MSKVEHTNEANGSERTRSKPTHRPISKGEIFDILSNHRRRYVFHYLKQENEPPNVGELAERVAAWEMGVSRAELPSKHRKRVYTSLQQFHLPKMERLGLIDCDVRTKLVTLTPEAEGLNVYFDATWKNDITWSSYYAGLSIIVGICGVTLWLDLYPFVLLPTSIWMIAASVLFLVSTLVHLRSVRDTQFGTAGLPLEFRTDEP